MLDKRLTQTREAPIRKRECIENIDALLAEAQNEPTDERKIEILDELQVWETELSHAKAWEQKIIAMVQRQHMQEHAVQT